MPSLRLSTGFIGLLLCLSHAAPFIGGDGDVVKVSDTDAVIQLGSHVQPSSYSNFLSSSFTSASTLLRRSPVSQTSHEPSITELLFPPPWNLLPRTLVESFEFDMGNSIGGQLFPFARLQPQKSYFIQVRCDDIPATRIQAFAYRAGRTIFGPRWNPYFHKENGWIFVNVYSETRVFLQVGFENGGAHGTVVVYEVPFSADLATRYNGLEWPFGLADAAESPSVPSSVDPIPANPEPLQRGGKLKTD